MAIIGCPSEGAAVWARGGLRCPPFRPRECAPLAWSVSNAAALASPEIALDEVGTAAPLTVTSCGDPLKSENDW